MLYTVVDGLPYADGKLVCVCASSDVSEQGELWYMSKLFPGVEWTTCIQEECLVYWIPVGTTAGTYKEILDYQVNTQELGGDYDNVEVLVDNELTMQCQTDRQLMLFCEEGVDARYWKLHDPETYREIYGDE
jgi:hypothetical protein